MPKLNQIIAVLSGLKTSTKEALTAAYHQLQKPELINGLSRTYRPKEDGGEVQPPESKRVQVKVDIVVASVTESLEKLFDTVLTQDFGNTSAFANISVNGVTLATDVPVTTLLFLEKQLEDIRTFIDKIPTLDPSESWSMDDDLGCYTSAPTETFKTKKVPKSHVKYEATAQHPAQVEMYHEDVTVGTWTTRKFSGAISPTRKADMMNRVTLLLEAVKVAREEANSIEVDRKRIGKAMLDFIFQK